MRIPPWLGAGHERCIAQAVHPILKKQNETGSKGYEYNTPLFCGNPVSNAVLLSDGILSEL
jgi:hypothetical protein